MKHLEVSPGCQQACTETMISIFTFWLPFYILIPVFIKHDVTMYNTVLIQGTVPDQELYLHEHKQSAAVDCACHISSYRPFSQSALK